jgi:hypothetical protein
MKVENNYKKKHKEYIISQKYFFFIIKFYLI